MKAQHLNLSDISKALDYAFQMAQASAVQLEHESRSGQYDSPSPSAYGRLITSATVIALATDKTRDEVTEAVKFRAREIFNTGQDYRRELELYKNLCNYGEE